MDTLWHELGFSGPDWPVLIRYALRLIIAAALGGVIGIEREAKGRAAGLRTHMLVAMGAALFTLVPMEASGPHADLSHVVKGIAAGIGFLGAGSILKKGDQDDIQGITTAAGIWLTAAIGFAVGAGWIGLSVIAAIVAWVILYVLSLGTNKTPK